MRGTSCRSVRTTSQDWVRVVWRESYIHTKYLQREWLLHMRARRHAPQDKHLGTARGCFPTARLLLCHTPFRRLSQVIIGARDKRSPDSGLPFCANGTRNPERDSGRDYTSQWQPLCSRQLRVPHNCKRRRLLLSHRSTCSKTRSTPRVDSTGEAHAL